MAGGGANGFVGREAELTVLRRALDASMAGRGRLVLVGGEPGIGKTRLAQELTEEAGSHGVEAVWAACCGGGAPAFWPWIQAVRAIAAVRADEELRDALGDVGEDIERLVPEVACRLGHTVVPLPPAQSPFRVFDAVTTFLLTAEMRPMLLVIDDLHWADASSVHLLGFLATQLSRSRMLVVATYREDECSEPIAALRDRLGGGHDHLLLSGLSRSGVAELATSLGSDPAQADVLHRRTNGNPFFVRELLHLGAAAGVPVGVRAVVSRRLAQCTVGCRDLLAAAAVAGEEFDVGVLDDARAGFLDEARAAHLIDVRQGRHRFVHALVREVLLEQLDEATRRVLHRQVGEKLQADAPPRDVEAATHLLRAVPSVDPEAAARAAGQAGARALDQLGYPTAIDLLAEATATLDRHRPDSPQRAELLVLLGEARRGAGELAQARQVFERAASAAREIGSPQALAHAALGMGTEFNFGVDEREVDVLTEALSALPPGDSSTRAALLARLARALIFDLDDVRRRQLGDESIAMARRIGDQRTLAGVLFDVTTAVWGVASVRERLAVAGEIVDAASQACDPVLRVQGRLLRIGALVELTDLPAARSEMEAVAQDVETLRQPQFRWQVALLRSTLPTLEGRFTEAERLADEALVLGRQVGHPAVTAFHAFAVMALRTARGYGEIVPGVAEAAARLPAPGWGIPLALGLCLQGRTDEARGHYERAIANLGELPRDFTWLGMISALAHLCFHLGDAKRAYLLDDLLAPSPGHLARISRTGAYSLGPVDMYRGMLALTTQRWSEAVERLTAAVAVCTRMGAHPYRAHAQYLLGRALRARGTPGDQHAARHHTDEAEAAAERLGVRLYGTAEHAAATGPRFVREGDFWTVAFRGSLVRLRHAVGLAHLAQLLAEPGREFAALDMVGGVAGGGVGPVLDASAKAAYRRRMQELADDIREAQQWADDERAARAGWELDALTEQLAAAVGLGGRDRLAASNAERARVAVTKAIKAALARITAADPELGEHLRRAVRTGAYCTYTGEHHWLTSRM